ncbi:DNA repair protein RecN [invertebrate metagenome]|uniref:DNA repair protein RecN n=1 Tax=invertebrate metagenome TaxID=1711999 RepID=A0A2H9T6L5_9ZZZZ
MLTHLSISNYTVADHLELDISSGMSVITGETGAGKSIILGALSLTLGGRANRDCIRSGASKADVRACFDLIHCPEATQWLKDRDLYHNEECILRRIVYQEGRSRNYINGVPSPLNDLKTIGQHLLDLHSQHEHQTLLQNSHHRILLDDFGQCSKLARKTAELAQKCKAAADKKQQLENEQLSHQEREQFLCYQLEELEQLNLSTGELNILEQQQQQLLHAEIYLKACHDVIDCCTENESSSLNQQLTFCQRLLSDLTENIPETHAIMDMLTSAQIQIEEASMEINRLASSISADPQQLLIVNERLSAIYDMARKHHIQPETLLEKQQAIYHELSSLSHTSDQMEQLNKNLDILQEKYQAAAQSLSKQRKKAAKQLTCAVTEKLKQLSMPLCKFNVKLMPVSSDMPSANGLESIEFQIATNPGQPLRALAKIASGGELSRISLAIQVVTAQTSYTPTLVFDEVDVGISGATAEQVGMMLQNIGQQGQVICITHQPQVAACSHHHFRVQKNASEESANTTVCLLSDSQRVKEIARMLAGIKITEHSLVHAKDMLHHERLLPLL